MRDIQLHQGHFGTRCGVIMEDIAPYVVRAVSGFVVGSFQRRMGLVAA